MSTTSEDDFTAYLTENPMPWPQLYEPGGLDSPLANALGMQTLPTMLLVDKEGKVVSRNLHAREIDADCAISCGRATRRPGFGFVFVKLRGSTAATDWTASLFCGS